MPHTKAEDILNARGTAIIASVIEELGHPAITIEHEAYYGRGPILSIKATNEHGNFTSRDFDFKDDSDLAALRLVNAIVRMIRERFDQSNAPDTDACSPTCGTVKHPGPIGANPAQ